MNQLLQLIAATVLLGGFNISPGISTSGEMESRRQTGTERIRQPVAAGNWQLIHLRHGEQQAPNSEAETLFRSALTLYREGKFDEALAICIKASTLNPNDYRPRALAGYIYLAQRKLKSASEAFADAIRVQPQVKELYLAKAEADFLRNAHEEARAACRKATEIDPNYAEAYAMLGNLLKFDKERHDEAITALRTAIKLKPTLPQPYDDLGGILASSKDEKGAEEIFRQGMAADPNWMNTGRSMSADSSQTHRSNLTNKRPGENFGHFIRG